jgi:hypothetical protein
LGTFSEEKVIVFLLLLSKCFAGVKKSLVIIVINLSLLSSVLPLVTSQESCWLHEIIFSLKLQGLAIVIQNAQTILSAYSSNILVPSDLFLYVLGYVYPLLGSDSEIRDCKTAFVK